MAFGAGMQLFDIAGGMVRQRVHLEVGPERLDRIQLGGIGRQKDSVHGAIAPSDLAPGGTMHVQAVPDDEHGSAELASEPAEEAEQGMRGDVLVREEAKVKSQLASSGRDGDRRDHGDALVGVSGGVNSL